MLAIPSPDVVINLFASAGQALGLVAIVVGRLFWKRSRGAARQSATPGRQGGGWAVLALTGLLLVTGASFLLYHFHVVDARTERLSVNLHRSSTEGGKNVGDTSLKTLSMSQQDCHPHGVPTELLAKWIASGEPLNLVDVREPEEIETGRIAGTWERRYPDLLRDPWGLVVPGAKTVLMCYSGNRSSELSDEFRKSGIDSGFLVGGYEKWIAEERPLVDAVARENLRAIPDYEGRDTLLDTPDVTELMAAGAVVIDVRHPDDLVRHTLPDAVSLPIRWMPTEEMYRALSNLPQRPIVVSCYDKRSSFYAQILGLRLHRLGKDFRGRYTTPHEFWRPNGERAHVAAWRQAQQSRSLVDVVAVPLGAALRWTRENVAGGSLALAIVLLVLALRLLILPLTGKSDRDQIVQAELQPKLRELRARFADDRARAGRAVLAAQRDAGLTPVRNFAGSLVVLVLFLVMFPVVTAAAAAGSESLLWLPDLGAPDPRHVLPVLVGALMAALVLGNAPRRTVMRKVMAAVVGVGVGALAVWLPAAVSLYLVVNLTLIVTQGRVLRAWLSRRDRNVGTPVRRRPAPTGGLVSLRDAAGLPAAGGKATRLGQLIEAGMPVPGGFVIVEGPGRPEPTEAELLAAFDRLGAERVAVRSSGVNEDGAERSYAGVFESELDVTRDELMAAIGRIRDSLRSDRAAAYSGIADERGSIVVQTMVPAEYAGVVFTEDPACSGTMLVEFVAGLGDALVSGRATPETLRFGRRSLKPADGGASPIDLNPLLEMARQAESYFGGAQDIEWAFADGRFFALQARDITATQRDGDGALIEGERERLLSMFADCDPETVVLEQDELAELLPAPTPFSAGLMEALWAPGGSVDYACRELGVPYEVREDGDPYVVTAFGRTFVHVAEARRRRGKGLGGVAAFRLSRSAENMERGFREVFLPEHLRHARLREALDPARLSTADLWSEYRRSLDGFICDTYLQAERINIAAEFHLRAACERLEKRDLDPAEILAQMPQTVVNEAYSVLSDADLPIGDAVQGFLERFGHRASHDFELSEPRYREQPQAVAERAQLVRGLSQGEAVRRHGSVETEQPALGRVDALCVDRARRFQALKEEAKHHCLRDLAHLRALVLELGARTGLGELVFELAPEELAELANNSSAAQVRELATARSRARRACLSLEVSERLSVADIETLGLVEASVAADGELHGARVAGSGDVVGRARVLRDVSDLETFEPGEVLVTHCTDPDWTPLFARAAGIVTEVGGWLSHAAIQAREYKLPAIVGARGAMAQIRTGQLVRLGSDGSIEVFEDRRRQQRFSASGRVNVAWDGGCLTARLRDLSRTGARLVLEGNPPAPGTRVTLEVDDDEPIKAFIASNGRPNQLGFSFRSKVEKERVQRLVGLRIVPAPRSA